MRRRAPAGLAAAVLSAVLLAPAAREVTVASGRLVHHALTNELFHIGDLWIRATPRTQFHRWLLAASGHGVRVVLTADASPFGDLPDVRILTGELMHGTAPQGSTVIHILYLRDPETRSLSPVTLETDDQAMAKKFDAYDGKTVSLVIDAR